MNVNALVKSALSELDLPVSWIEHRGSETEYIVFDFEETPSLYGDNTDDMISAAVSIYYFTTSDPIETISKIRNALRAADFLILETFTTVDSSGNRSGDHKTVYKTLIRTRLDGCSDIWR